MDDESDFIAPELHHESESIYDTEILPTIPPCDNIYSFSIFWQSIKESLLCCKDVWKWIAFWACIYICARKFCSKYYYPTTYSQILSKIGITSPKDQQNVIHNIQSGLLYPKLADHGIQINNFRQSTIAGDHLMSLIYSIMTVGWTYYGLFIEDKLKLSDVYKSIYFKTPESHHNIINMVLGYTIVDIIHLWKYERIWSLLIHHLLGTITGSSLKCMNYGGQIFSSVFYVSDITTIILQFSWYVRDKLKILLAIEKYICTNVNGNINIKYNYNYNEKLLKKMIQRQKKMKGILQFLFSVVFLYLRTYVIASFGPYYAYTNYNAKHIKSYYKIVSVGICICFLGVGYIWSAFIVRKLYLDLFGKQKCCD